MNSDCNKPALICVLIMLWGAGVLEANPFLGSSEDPTHQVAQAGPPSQGLAEKQLALRDRMADLLLSLKSGESPRLLFLLWGLSFLYGILHASGPGHRKTIVFSLYLSRRAKAYEPLAFGFLLAFLHGTSAVLLILLYRTTAGPLLSRSINATSMQMEGWAYTLLACLAAVLLAGAVRHTFKGHQHSQRQGKSLFAVALTGLYPCPGAIMILVFSLTHGILLQGILAIAFMNLGMALPISLAGYLAYLGKRGVFGALKKREFLLHRISSGLELGGYSFLLVFSALMALPFLLSYLP